VLAPTGPGSCAPLGTQAVYVHGQWVQAQRYARLDLPVGFAVQGPAIFEQADTTVWLEPGYEATVDDLGNLVLQRGRDESCLGAD
jgi:N-methylhydantoinase A